MKIKGFALVTMVFTMAFSFGQKKTEIKLWPNAVPGQTVEKYKAEIYPDSSNGVIRLSPVTDPLVTVYLPKEGKENKDAGVIICPGGGNKYLAINLEGSEVAEWFTQLGYTAFVLQYRVPHNRKGALQDVQRAVRLIRNDTKKWGLDKNKIGVMGFSAGGNLAARAGTEFNIQSYPPIDAVDSIPCRPDFVGLLYPGTLSTGEDHHLIAELKNTVDQHSAPTFIFAANDDPVGVPFSFAKALHYARVPLEFHVFRKGGHGYGLRRGNPAAEEWPGHFAAWLKKTL